MLPFNWMLSFGNQFPYTNFHDMNLDWIIAICKDLATKFPKLVAEVLKKLNAPEQEGVAGQFLVNLGNGKTEWKDMDESIAPVIIEAVYQWLDEHPEATTTVQDGAISPVKLDTELYNLYKKSGNVQYFFPNLSEGGYSGCSALMVTPSKTVLFDANASMNITPTIAYYNELYTKGVFTNIDYIVISHYHWDHVEGLRDILQNFPHNNCHMYIPISPSGYYVASIAPELVTNYDMVVSVAEEFSIPYTVVNETMTVAIDNHTNITLLNSDISSYQYYSNVQANYNNYSMVSLIKTGNCYSMFPGDLERLGQERVTTLNTLPRLFLYSEHHHGMQNDDYLPYIDAINPEYMVIPTSYNRMVVTGYRGMMQKLFNGKLGSTGYDSYSFTCNASGGIITHGIEIPANSFINTTITYYVDNSYTGNEHDGSVSKPFTTISEAVAHIIDRRNITYNIIVKASQTVYDGVYIRYIKHSPVTIQGLTDENYGALVKWFYVGDTDNLTLTSLSVVDGYEGYPIGTGFSAIVALNSNIVVRDCIMNGSTIATNSYAIAHENSKIRFSGVTMSNYDTGNSATGINPSEIYCSTCTFENITYLFRCAMTKVIIWEGNTFTNVPNVVVGNVDRMIPFIVTRSLLTTVAPLCSASAISEQTYVNASHPIVMIADGKMWDVLTGEQYTP